MKILIVGAGIAGLSMARLLQKQGLDFTIIEKKPAASTVGAGIALPFNALRALKEIGVYDEVMAHAHQVREIHYTTAQGKLLAQADLTAPPFAQDKFIALKRKQLQDVLLSGLEDKIRYATELTAVDNQIHGVKVNSNNGDIDGRYDLVIAADGINSGLRAEQYPNRHTLYRHKLPGWRFVIKVEQHQLQPLYMLGKSDLFMAYPLSEDELYCYAHIHEDNDSHPLSGDAKKDLRAIFCTYGGPVGKILQALDDVEVICGELKSVDQARYYKDRIVFIGDAANACSPLLQQGAAAAFEDAICLVESLIKDENIGPALEQYKQARRTRIEWIINYSDKPLASIKKMEKALPRFIRNTLIRLLGPFNVFGWKKLATQAKLANKRKLD
ncbi:FAD-dependent oxidoreductase [Thalassomonas sp. RHCl1]|uniref:FAD-dependent oxidoreductase n=1 Tax=Thalassomonas sp. RHCl1 TaxID=2995320 RepID=UPI00248C25A5|nr:FAD-dependent oxidoreductase [Thalassomonas sp. RHCl1]